MHVMLMLIVYTCSGKVSLVQNLTKLYKNLINVLNLQLFLSDLTRYKFNKINVQKFATHDSFRYTVYTLLFDYHSFIAS